MGLFTRIDLIMPPVLTRAADAIWVSVLTQLVVLTLLLLLAHLAQPKGLRRPAARH